MLLILKVKLGLVRNVHEPVEAKTNNYLSVCPLTIFFFSFLPNYYYEFAVIEIDYFSTDGQKVVSFPPKNVVVL